MTAVIIVLAVFGLTLTFLVFDIYFVSGREITRLKRIVKDIGKRHETLDWYVYTIAHPLKFKYNDIVYSFDLDKSRLEYSIEEFKVLESWYENPPTQKAKCRVDFGGGTTMRDQNSLKSKEELIERSGACCIFKVNVSEKIIDKDIINLAK